MLKEIFLGSTDLSLDKDTMCITSLTINLTEHGFKKFEQLNYSAIKRLGLEWQKVKGRVNPYLAFIFS